MPLPTTFTGWSSLSMMASPHLLQMRLVRWLSSSRFASEARAVFESSPFLGIDTRPLSSIFLLDCCFLYLDLPEVLMYLAMGYEIRPTDYNLQEALLAALQAKLRV